MSIHEEKEDAKAAVLPVGKMITMRDVAKLSGFSPTTVSITLNDAPLARYLPEETKSRIRQTAQQLGYRPNPFARSLVNQRSHSIGLMVFDITDPYCTLILRGIEKKLFQSSYLPIFTDVHNDPVRFQRYLEMLLDRRVDALIIIANWLVLDIDVLNDVASRDIPKVLIGSRLPETSISAVDFDNEQGAYLAIEHLHQLGHRDIAFIRGPQRLWDTEPRWHGIQSFAAKADLSINQDLVFDLSESEEALSSFEGGFRAAQQLLQSGRRFTALLAFDDLSAMGAMQSLQQAGIRVPQDCSIIGFDDIPAASLCAPALTTIRQPMELMGSIAADIVIEQVSTSSKERKDDPVSRTVGPELIIRGSTATIVS